jgi:NAD(P)H-hydrate epimerase
MATAGSGDVLLGILTALLAQGYTPEEAAILGSYLHGLAGDFAAKRLTMPSMAAGDIVEHLPQAFHHLEMVKNQPGSTDF